MQIPNAMINFSAELKPTKSKTCLYKPSSSREVSDTMEINGMIAEMPIVSTSEKPIIITSINNIKNFCLLVNSWRSLDMAGFKNNIFSNSVMIFSVVNKPISK